MPPEADTDTSDHAAVERLMSLLPEDSLTIGQEPARDDKTADKPVDDKPAPEVKDAPAEGEPKVAEAKPEDDVEIEIKGERYKVPPAIRDSIMMHADYTKKTMDLAEKERVFNAEKAKLNPQEIDTVKQKLTHYEQLLGQSVIADQQTDWVQLLKEDPIGYLERKEMASRRAQEWEVLTAQRNQENQAKNSQTLEQETAQLIAKRPDWKDVAVYQADRAKINASLAKSGYRADEIQGIADHRALLIADKARKYDELMAAKVETAKKIEKLPPKVERPGVANGAEGQASKAAMTSLRKSGSIDDAAAALRALMN